ncbi:MAG: hypothetical protein V4731_18620 [Pseudomonadota bacterium]
MAQPPFRRLGGFSLACALLFALGGFAPGLLHAQTLAQTPAKTTQTLVDEARAAAQKDRNREAADLFAQAIRQAPERRAELAREYADQLTYSDRAREAVPLYRELLAANPPTEARLPLLKGLGLSLLWSDEPAQAAEAYRQAITLSPTDIDARRNYAQGLSWSGRQRESAEVLRGILRTNPDDEKARLQLAQSLRWLGRSDSAFETLSGANTGQDDAARLLRELDDQAAPRTRADVQKSTQSDNLDIERTRISHEVTFDKGRGMLGGALEHFSYRQQGGTGSADVDRPSVRGRYRFNDNVELNAEVGQDRIDVAGSPGSHRTVYSSWLTLWPSDIVRIDLSTRKSTLDSLTSLQLGVTTTQNRVSATFTPDERQRYSADLEAGRYSDGNRRALVQVQGEYRWLRSPEVWVGARHQRMDYSQGGNTGYFNPDKFNATQATLRASYKPGGDASAWDLGGIAALGREHADPGGSKPSYDLSLAAGYRITPRTRLEARRQRFSSRTGLSGFARTTSGLSLEHAW